MNVAILLIGVFSYVFGIVTIYFDVRNGTFDNLFVAVSGTICSLIGLGLFFKIIREYFDSNTEKSS